LRLGIPWRHLTFGSRGRIGPDRCPRLGCRLIRVSPRPGSFRSLVRNWHRTASIGAA
jgi:hypothetical protein